MADSVVSEKQCSKCRILRSASEFCMVKRTRDNPGGELGAWCAFCRSREKELYRERKSEAAKFNPPDERKCKVCSETKPISEFGKHVTGKDGHCGTCKKCRANARGKRDRARPFLARERYVKNRDKFIEFSSRYSKKNRDRINKWQRERGLNDVSFTLNRRMQKRIRKSLKGNKNRASWKNLVPYSVAELKSHLMSTMPKGHSWADFLAGRLHIDHIIPISAFNIRSPQDIDFQKCWALKNLRLLPSAENLAKHAKLTKPFQPSFTGL